MSAVDILREARERLAQPGAWAQGFDVTLNVDRYCASTALTAVAGGDFEERGVARLALFRAVGVWSLNQLIGWNDAPERTLDEVLVAFDAAILGAAGIPYTYGTDEWADTDEPMFRVPLDRLDEANALLYGSAVTAQD